MHPYVRRNVLSGDVGLHRRRIPREFLCQRSHGPLGQEGRRTCQLPHGDIGIWRHGYFRVAGASYYRQVKSQCTGANVTAEC